MLARLAAASIVVAAFFAASPARADDSAARMATGFSADRDAYLGERRGLMIGLTAWSAVNLVGNTFLLTDPLRKLPDPPRPSFRRAFAGVGLAYAVINLALAVGTLASIGSTRAGLTRPSILDEQRGRGADVFVANAGLDMVYVTVGAALWSKGPTEAARGAGAGFFTQGAFLLGFDTLGSVLYRYAR